jgi:hypothetical protein
MQILPSRRENQTASGSMEKKILLPPRIQWIVEELTGQDTLVYWKKKENIAKWYPYLNEETIRKNIKTDTYFYFRNEIILGILEAVGIFHFDGSVEKVAQLNRLGLTDKKEELKAISIMWDGLLHKDRRINIRAKIGKAMGISQKNLGGENK